MRKGTNRSLTVRSIAAQWHVPMPILAIAGPLLGLGYIVVFPFIGVAAFVLTSAYRAKQSLATR